MVICVKLIRDTTLISLIGKEYLFSPAFLEKLYHFLPEFRILKGIINNCLYISQLISGIISFALELICIYRMVLKQPANCICQLDLISGTWWRSLQVIEDFRNKSIPACDRAPIIWTNQARVVHQRSFGGSSKPPGSLPVYPVHISGYLHN